MLRLDKLYLQQKRIDIGDIWYSMLLSCNNKIKMLAKTLDLIDIKGAFFLRDCQFHRLLNFIYTKLSITDSLNDSQKETIA